LKYTKNIQKKKFTETDFKLKHVYRKILFGKKLPLIKTGLTEVVCNIRRLAVCFRLLRAPQFGRLGRRLLHPPAQRQRLAGRLGKRGSSGQRQLFCGSRYNQLVRVPPLTQRPRVLGRLLITLKRQRHQNLVCERGSRTYWEMGYTGLNLGMPSVFQNTCYLLKGYNFL
jgi:hypothetical protein